MHCQDHLSSHRMDDSTCVLIILRRPCQYSYLPPSSCSTRLQSSLFAHLDYALCHASRPASHLLLYSERVQYPSHAACEAIGALGRATEMDGLNRGGVTEMPSSSCDRVSSGTSHFSSLHYDFVLARGAQHVASMNLRISGTSLCARSCRRFGLQPPNSVLGIGTPWRGIKGCQLSRGTTSSDRSELRGTLRRH